MVANDDHKKGHYQTAEQRNRAEKERRVIRDLETKYSKLKEDEVWCVIDAKWFTAWKQWTSYEEKRDETRTSYSTSRPEAIDNSHLLKSAEELDLRQDIVQERDFNIIHKKVWDVLSDWYTGYPSIKRKVVQEGTSYNVTHKVNLYPVFLKWGYANDSQPDGLPKVENRKVTQMSRTWELKRIRQYFKQKAPGVNKTGSKWDVRLHMPLGVINKLKEWFIKPSEDDKKRFIEVSPEEDLTMLEECDFSGHELHLLVSCKKVGKWSYRNLKPFQYRLGEMYDIRDKKKRYYEGFIRAITKKSYRVHFINWDETYDEEVPIKSRSLRFFERGSHTKGPYTPRPKSAKSRSSSYSSGRNIHEKGKSTDRGMVGLRNLGNTCFMNSTLQCLMQSPWLTDFFLNEEWKKQLNRKNVLGKKGRVAEEYGALIQAVFSNEFRVVAPRDFKRVIGQFAPQFMGYQQQDSQELLAFLLDGLHEDLNRIKVKPYSENKDSDGREDNLVANETWETYKKRNNSIIVDLLQGQYKSKVKCPDCHRTSITFDPFMYLTVPLPTEKYKVQPVTYVPADGSAIIKYGIKVRKRGTVADLKNEIGEKFNIEPSWIVVADIWRNKIHRVCDDGEKVINFRSTEDLWVYNTTPSIMPKFEKKEPSDNATDSSETRGREKSDAKGIEPTYLQCQIINVAKRQQYSYSASTQKYIPPFFITLPKVVEQTCEDIFNQICDLLKGYGFWKPTEDEKRQDVKSLPFRMTWAVESKWGSSLRNVNDLAKSSEKFSIRKKVKFTVHWKKPLEHDIKLLKDESYPKEGHNAGTESVSMSSCLSAFTEEETLSEDNAWYCSKCKKFQMANKKIDLWRLPDLLVIHLKRFSCSRRYRTKISSLVNFPLEDLNLKDWISPNCRLKQTTKYDLYGVSMHSGGLGGGHYTAYVQSLDNKKWYYLNDSNVSRAEATSTQSPAAYLLFYRRQQRG